MLILYYLMKDSAKNSSVQLDKRRDGVRSLIRRAKVL